MLFITAHILFCLFDSSLEFPGLIFCKYSAAFFARAPGKAFFRERRFGVSSVQKMALQGTHIALFYRKTHSMNSNEV